MAKLTDMQRVVLSSAAACDDGLGEIPAKMGRAAASKVGSSLVARKLMREAKAKPGMPVWREDEDGRPISLAITKAGREAIGVDENGDQGAPVPEVQEKAAKHATSRTNGPKPQRPMHGRPQPWRRALARSRRW